MVISISCQKTDPFNYDWYLGFFLASFLINQFYCLCLCLRLEQMTIIRPRLHISRHFSQILRTEAFFFIFVITYLICEYTFGCKKISFFQL